MREPSLPNNTCPAIDDVQEAINKAIDAANEAAHHLHGQVRELEELRSANSDLRRYGEYWHEQYEELMTANDELESEVQRLKSEIESLQYERIER